MNKKQFIFPLVVLLLGVAGYWGFAAMDKPPAEKPPADNRPLVTVLKNQLVNSHFSVSSYGVVKGKYATELVAQVAGEITYISDNFVRGGFVKQGELLAEIDSSDYDVAVTQAQANIASAQAALVLERAQAEVAKKQWRDIKNSQPTPLALREPQVAQQQARLLSAKAALQSAQKNRQRTLITAPFDALIDSRKIALGSYLSVGSPVANLLSTAQAEIRLPVADHELRYLIDKGVGAKVTLFAELAGVRQQWPGTIIRSEGIIDERNRMNYLVAEVNDPYALSAAAKIKNELRYGSYVTAIINGRMMHDMSIIDRHLLIDGKVALVNKQQQLHLQEVTIARTVGAQLFISAGLKEGDLLITSPLDYPIEGMPVQISRIAEQGVSGH